MEQPNVVKRPHKRVSRFDLDQICLSPFGFSSGFALVELLAFLAIFGFLAVGAANLLRTLQPRLTLRAAGNSAAVLINQARLEAIKRQVTTCVQPDLTRGELVAFADLNGDPTVGSPGHARYLVFDPDPVLISTGQTDYEIGRIRLPETIAFGSPGSARWGAEAITGLTVVPQMPPVPNAVVFSPRGKILAPGAIRLVDGPEGNHLEVAMLGLAGKVTLRKYLQAADAPNGEAGFFAEGNDATGANVWTWY